MASENAPQHVLEATAEATVRGAVPVGESIHPRGEHASHDPLSAETLMHHVKDADHFLLPRVFSPRTDGKLYIPQFRDSKDTILEIKTGIPPIDNLIEPFNLQITKFMVLEVVGALILMAVFIPLARRLKSGARPRGRLTNLLEAMVLFIRDQVARPTIGSHDGDRFAPFLLNIFFFVLICNLLGLVPWAGSPTGALATTAALAVITFVTVVVAGSVKLGPLGFWLGQVPHMDVPWVIGIVLKPLIFALESFGLLIKHFVLAMRLLSQHDGGARGVGRLDRVHSRLGRHVGFFWRGPGQPAGFGGTQHVGVICGLPAGVHIRVLDGTVHRDGSPSPLILTEAYAM